MKKIVINTCHGGFGVSLVAAEWMADQGHSIAKEDIRRTKETWEGTNVSSRIRDTVSLWNIERDDPILIKVIEHFGSEVASGSFAELEIVEIPDDVDWTIEEYDGNEWIAEVHRTWC